MPRLNRDGDYLLGVGGGGASLHIAIGNDREGAVVPIGDRVRQAICAHLGIAEQGSGSGWVWQDEDTIAGQLCDLPSGCLTFTYNLESGAVVGPFGAGANDARGRGGTVAWWLGGTGVYDTNGYRHVDAGLGDVLANGDVVYGRDYQQQMPGFVVVRGRQVLREIPTLGQWQGVFARGSVVLWFDFGDQRLHADGAPDPIAIDGANAPGPHAADRQGRRWILDASQGLLLRAWDAPVGYWLSRDGRDFWSDLVPFESGFRIVSSTDQGETPGSTRVYDLDPLTGVMTRNGGAPETVPLINLENGEPSALPIYVSSAGTIGSAPDDLARAMRSALAGTPAEFVLIALGLILAIVLTSES